MKQFCPNQSITAGDCYLKRGIRFWPKISILMLLFHVTPGFAEFDGNGAIGSGSGADNVHREVVERTAREFMHRRYVPGVAVAYIYEGKPYFLNMGVADIETGEAIRRDTIFELGSVTKIFTATQLALAVLYGETTLAAPVTDLLPPWVGRRGGAIKQVTLEELATHTSSLPRLPPHVSLPGYPDYTQKDLLEFVSRWEPDYPVGSKYKYSNIGFGLLGDALSYQQHEQYFRMIHRDILSPLDMKHTFAEVPRDLRHLYAKGHKGGADQALAVRWDPRGWAAAGILRSTATDMMNMLKANMSIGDYDQNLTKAMEMTHKGYFDVKPGFVQGLAWARHQENGLTIIAKDGSTAGFSTFIAFLEHSKMGVVMLANKADANPQDAVFNILERFSEISTQDTR